MHIIRLHAVDKRYFTIMCNTYKIEKRKQQPKLWSTHLINNTILCQ